MEDEQGSERPSTARSDKNVYKIRDFARLDRRLTAKMTEEELNLSYATLRQV